MRVVVLAALVAAAMAAPRTPISLTTNYLPNPVYGVDIAPVFGWTVPADGQPRLAPQEFMTAYQVVVAGEDGKTLWDSGVTSITAGELPRVEMPLNLLQSDSVYTWKVRIWDSVTPTVAGAYSAPAMFTTGLLKAADWAGASWILDSTIMRRSVVLPTGTVKRATAYIVGLGYHQLFIDGVRVGTNQLDPTPTFNENRALYVTHDVTKLLANGGSHGVGIMLGIGWSSARKALMVIIAHYADGSVARIVTDNGWRVSSNSPVVADSIYNGETYDARREIACWSNAVCPQCDGWSAPKLADKGASPVLYSQLMQPMKRYGEINPISFWKSPSGSIIYDLGQNFAGWAELYVKGPAGTTVKMHFAESRMHPPYGEELGGLYYGNLRGAQATATFILKGTGSVEVYEPRFTYFGYRYVEVTGLPEAPTLSTLKGIVINSDLVKRGSFTASDGLLQQMHHNNLWGTLSNLYGVPTDCPQRDERMAWMGDAALAAELNMYNLDITALFSNFLRVIEDNQYASGLVPSVHPFKWDNRDPSWGTAYPTLAESVLQFDNAASIVRDRYASIARYLGYLKSQHASTGLKAMYFTWGDWCPPPPAAKCSGHFTASAAYLHDVKKMIDLADAAGKPSDSAAFATLFQTLSKEFNDVFLNRNLRYYGSGSQTEQAIPLWLGIVPSDMKSAVLTHLVDEIVVTKYSHLSTGIIGLRYMLETLADNGRADIALLMLSHMNYPSFGYQILDRYEPATTVWELFNGDSEGPGMNSRNHIMFGTIETFLYKSVGALRLGAGPNGFGTVVVKPDVAFVRSGTSVSSASATVKTARGTAHSFWHAPDDMTSNTCGFVEEGSPVVLSCPRGQVIKTIDFASFGNPTGSCTGGLTRGNCHAQNSTTGVAALCLGRGSCRVSGSTDFFGEPCYNTRKRFGLKVTCGEGAAAPNCVTAPENNVVSLSCPYGTISKITFASYGAPGPAGWNCAKSLLPGSCGAPTTMNIVNERCLGKQRCSIMGSNAMFGADPCYGTAKSIAISWNCSAPVQKYAVVVSATIPPTSTGEVYVPKPPGVPMVVMESEKIVWKDGVFVPSVKGVTAASDAGKFVVFKTVSGSYTFNVPM